MLGSRATFNQADLWTPGLLKNASSQSQMKAELCHDWERNGLLLLELTALFPCGNGQPDYCMTGTNARGTIPIGSLNWHSKLKNGTRSRLLLCGPPTEEINLFFLHGPCHILRTSLTNLKRIWRINRTHHKWYDISKEITTFTSLLKLCLSSYWKLLFLKRGKNIE